MSLADGLYDQLLTEPLAGILPQRDGTPCYIESSLAPEEAAERLAEELARQLSRLLDELKGEGKEKVRQQLAITNGLLAKLRRQTASRPDLPAIIADPPRVLKAVSRTGTLPEPPETGLAFPWLFTAGKASPSLLTELRREIGSCDSADILVSFITVSGVRKLADILQHATAVDASGAPRTRLRILTTTYTGATEMEALDYLARLPGCEVKVSLDGRRTRLHAKAWIFRRRTGFGSAYVGSANLSGAALLGGLEWTVKFTEAGQPELYARATAHFETLWNDTEFQHYDPANARHREELARALRLESGEATPGAVVTFFDLVPKDYQQAMLDQLALERQHGRFRNLVVAATGTGKTVVAAFDYRRICDETGGRPRMLFVAHREEILKQARSTWQQVLRDSSFGELLVGGASPASYDHLFATIDSVTSRGLLERFGPDYWHTVIIDECHRMAGTRFDALATAVRPRILLGLTATPERSDGKPIFPYFENRPDGSPAVEMRLWHALDLQLLAPFEYYGCDDETDFSSVPWDEAGEKAALDKVLTGNHVRARLIVNEWRRLSGNPRRCRALAFCVSVEHARFMTEQFNAAGLPALLVVGSTDPEERRQAPRRLESGEVCVLVTCDLYNEGVDIPQVDTLLLLRPTQSPVLFQQQLGRGLRLYPGKTCCLVLDFVGRHRQEFRFDRLFSVLTGLTRGQLVEAVEKGFSGLPPGCHIQLQPQARDQVLRSLRATINQNWRRLRAELQSFAAVRGRTTVKLAEFLHDTNLEVEEIYRPQGRSGWTALRRDAGLLNAPEQPEDEYFGRRYSSLLHCDDPEQLDLLTCIADPAVRYEQLTPRQQRRLQMLAYQIDGQHAQTGSGADFLERLAASPDLRAELGELGAVLQSRETILSHPIPGLEDVPLCLHASYEIREILTAVGWLTAERRTPFQAGVLPLADRRVELLFVTLDKSDGFHDRISYSDYALSPERFHWQTQNTAAPTTMAGRRYLESPGNGWTFQLFVRRTPRSPYRACGPVVLESAEGARPMSIVWRLRVPLPVRLFQEFSVLRGS